MKNKRRGPSWQTILLILAAVVGWAAFRLALNPGGGRSGAFDSYSGPILPLTAISGGEGLEVERQVEFDFSPYEHYEASPVDPAEVIVTDTYLLTNPTDSAMTVTLAYPYEGRFVDERKYTPTITLDGNPMEGMLYPSVDGEREIFQARDFVEYQRLMTENNYYTQAVSEPPAADIPVKVYHFTDITYHGAREDPYIFLTVDFRIPEGASVWALHYDVMRLDDETGECSLWLHEDLDEKDMAYLFIMGGELEDLTFGGNLGHNLTENSALTDVTAEYETYDSTFSQLLWDFAQGYDYWAVYEEEPNPGLMTPEILWRDAMKRIGAHPEQGWAGTTGEAVSIVEEAFYKTMTTPRLLYWVFPVEIPAGGTVEVRAQYHQEASTDFHGAKQDRDGYDLATRLGSSLDFTEQSAAIKGWEFIEILRQNFGFRPNKGITGVILDPDVERYYLEVTGK